MSRTVPGGASDYLPVWAKAVLRQVDTHPATTLLVPPLVFLLQFFQLLALVKLGFPNNADAVEVPVSLLLIGLFGSSGLCLLAACLGVRQVFVLPVKALPVVGVAANALYLAGFIFFFLLILVLQNLT